MSHKKPRKPYHYNKKSSSRTKPQSEASLKFVLAELMASGYEIVTTEDTTKHRKAGVLALAWFQKDYPDAAYSKSGRTITMTDKLGQGTISVPVSDGQLSRDALKDLRKRTGLALDPEADDADVSTGRNAERAEANDNAPVPMGDNFADAATDEEDDDDDFDWEDDDIYVVVPKDVVAEPEVKKSRTVTRTRRPRESDPRP